MKHKIKGRGLEIVPCNPFMRAERDPVGGWKAPDLRTIAPEPIPSGRTYTDVSVNLNKRADADTLLYVVSETRPHFDDLYGRLEEAIDEMNEQERLIHEQDGRRGLPLRASVNRLARWSFDFGGGSITHNIAHVVCPDVRLKHVLTLRIADDLDAFNLHPDGVFLYKGQFAGYLFAYRTATED